MPDRKKARGNHSLGQIYASHMHIGSALTVQPQPLSKPDDNHPPQSVRTKWMLTSCCQAEQIGKAL